MYWPIKLIEPLCAQPASCTPLRCYLNLSLPANFFHLFTYFDPIVISNLVLWKKFSLNGPKKHVFILHLMGWHGDGKYIEIKTSSIHFAGEHLPELEGYALAAAASCLSPLTLQRKRRRRKQLTQLFQVALKRLAFSLARVQRACWLQTGEDIKDNFQTKKKDRSFGWIFFVSVTR